MASRLGNSHQTSRDSTFVLRMGIKVNNYVNMFRFDTKYISHSSKSSFDYRGCNSCIKQRNFCIRLKFMNFELIFRKVFLQKFLINQVCNDFTKLYQVFLVFTYRLFKMHTLISNSFNFTAGKTIIYKIIFNNNILICS